VHTTDNSGGFALNQYGNCDVTSTYGTAHIAQDGTVTFSPVMTGNPHAAHSGTFEIWQHGVHVADVDVTSWNHNHQPADIVVTPVTSTQHDEADPGESHVDSVTLVPDATVAVVHEDHASSASDAAAAQSHDLADPVGSVAGEPGTDLDKPDHVPDTAHEPPAASAGHLDPYLAMVGADGGGNGGEHPPVSDAASPYLDAVGATPDTATPPPDDLGADHAAAVPDHDPFTAGPDHTDDQVQAIEGTPGDEAPIDTPAVPDADLDPHQHG
jgi:hypothetical protein